MGRATNDTSEGYKRHVYHDDSDDDDDDGGAVHGANQRRGDAHATRTNARGWGDRGVRDGTRGSIDEANDDDGESSDE